MKKVLLIALACIGMALSANADKLANHTNRVSSNAIKIGVFSDGLTHYMKGFTVTLLVNFLSVWTNTTAFGLLTAQIDALGFLSCTML